MRKTEHSPVVVDTESETNSGLPMRWLRGKGARVAALSLVGIVAGGATAGCVASETPPSPSSTSSEVPREIPLFADLAFSQHIGDIATYDIICTYRKDANNPSIQPDNALAYQVFSTDPYGRRGIVDPTRGGLISGSARECSDPPYPQPSPESAPSSPA